MPDPNGIGRGIVVQSDPELGLSSAATLRSTIVERSVDMGVAILGSIASVEGCRITRTQARSDGRYGDGLVALHEGAETTVHVDASRIESSARAGLSSFGAAISLRAVAIDCSELDLDGEPHDGQDFHFDDRDGNTCGCPAANGPCVAASAGLAPPEQITPSGSGS
jgi:hypothetical protein